MAITVYVGKPGHGKTIALMRKFQDECRRVERIFNKTGQRIVIKTSIIPSPKIYARYAFYIELFRDLDWLPNARDCVIFIDEMGTYFDSRQWASLGPEVIHSLRLHRHRGIDIYGATQEFTQVDVTIRRLTTRLYRCKKLFSTGEPLPNTPVSAFAFMLGTVALVKPEHREIETEFQETDFTLPSLYDKDDFLSYDTHQEMDMIPLSPLYLRPRIVIKLDKENKILSKEEKYTSAKL